MIISENRIKFWLNIKLCFHSNTREAIGYENIKRDNNFSVTELFNNIMQFFHSGLPIYLLPSHKFLSLSATSVNLKYFRSFGNLRNYFFATLRITRLDNRFQMISASFALYRTQPYFSSAQTL